MIMNANKLVLSLLTEDSVGRVLYSLVASGVADETLDAGESHV